MSETLKHPPQPLILCNLSHNKLHDLPPWITPLFFLDFIISENPLSKLPENECKINFLTANNTNLTYLPDWIGSSPYLHGLYLNGTPLESLPEFHVPHQKIQQIDLRNTPIEKLPESINSIDLKELYISDESLKKYITNPHINVIVNYDVKTFQYSKSFL